MPGPHLPFLLTILATSLSLAAASVRSQSHSSQHATAEPASNRPASASERQTLPATLQDPKKHATQLRAAYILKLAPYITAKPPKPDADPFVIAVAGHDSFADAIVQLLPGKEINKRKVKVVIVDPTIAATSSKHDYDLLYVATSVDALVVAGIIKQHKTTATPLFSERPGFASKGGGLQLFIKDNKVKFEVNQTALKEQGLHVSPQLMKLSTKGPEQ